MGVVEGDEIGGAVRAVQLYARDVQRTVALGSGGEDDRIVELPQLVDLDIHPDVHVAEELDPIGLHDLVQGDDDLLDPRVIGRDTVADQAVRGRQPVEDVDGQVRVALAQDVGGVDAGGTGSDDSDAQAFRHVPNSLLDRLNR